MRGFLDKYTVAQIVAACIIAAVLGMEILFYIIGDGWFGVKLLTIGIACLAAVWGLVYAVAWLCDYIEDRKYTEEIKEKRKKEEGKNEID